MKKRIALGLVLALFIVGLARISLFLASGQRPDLDFDTSVAEPAFAREHPAVLFDEAHHNFHKANGRYKPFASLIEHDGCCVKRNGRPFDSQTLKGCRLLVIANAKGPKGQKAESAFTAAECDAVEAWVRGGGSLLLITDHYPIGPANQDLARRFGVDMGLGETDDPQHCDRVHGDESQLVFARDAGLLGVHPILEGRNPTEQIHRVMTFTGQSLQGPAASVPLLVLSETAVDLKPVSVQTETSLANTRTTITFGDPVPARGRCQALAMEHGLGRVVVTGEAAMLTAQIDEHRFGMNLTGIDNRQLALNIVRWLLHGL